MINTDFSDKINECNKKFDIFNPSDNQIIPLSVAQHMIKHSIWWDHPSAGMVRAPKHANRVSDSINGWEISLGANSFLISLSINRCLISLRKFIEKIESGDFVTKSVIDEKLIHQVVCSVANYNGDIYQSPYKTIGPWMEFGTTSINVNEFTGIIANTIGIYKICA